MNHECLIVFVKSPQPGNVKTRLAREIGDDLAAALYRCFILDLADTVGKLPQDVVFCHAPKDCGNMFRAWLGEGFDFVPQADGDLGERMKQAFLQAFQKGYERVAVIGSDTPDLPVSLLLRAFDELKDAHAVIGPSTDGGYWLMGFHPAGFCPEVFEGIAWSTETVFADTMKKFEEKSRRVQVLPQWTDIDTLDSLRQWLASHDAWAGTATHTLNLLGCEEP